MPKRKRDRSSDEEYDNLARKIKKLERKLKRKKRRRYLSDSSLSNCDNNMLSHNHSETQSNVSHNEDIIGVCDVDTNMPGCSYWTDEVPQLLPDISQHTTSAAATPASFLVESAISVPPPKDSTAEKSSDLPPSTDLQNPQDDDNTDSILTLQKQSELMDPELLMILGEDPTATTEYGKEIQKDLAIRLNHIFTAGISKENRKELKEKYLIPANCKLIKAPTLNPEIRASLNESQAKRDKGIEGKQTLTSCAISSLSNAITLVMSSKDLNPELLKLLMDTARILSDIQHSDSMLRRFFILSTVKKELKDQLEKTKIDDWLFGTTLAETLKSAKNISKSGAELRMASTVKSVPFKQGKTNNLRNLNYKAPLGNRRPPPPGGAKGSRMAPSPGQRTTTTSTHPSASRTSSRQPQRPRR